MTFHRQTRYQDTAIGKLPLDWEVARLRDVADYVNGYAFKPSDWEREGLPIIRIKNLNDPNARFNHFKGQIESRYIVEKGDLLFSWSASIGAYLWKRSRAVLNQHIFKVVPNERIAKSFLYYALFLAIRQLSSRVHGSTMKHFRRGELDTLIPLPPFAEQNEIAEILSVVDEVIHKTNEIISKTELLKKGLMQELLAKGIGHKEFKDTEIGAIPEEWSIAKLGDVLELCQYGLSVPMSEEGTYPIIRMDEINNGYVMPKIAKRVDLDDETFRGFRLEKGDILFNRTNSYDLVGRTGIFLLDGDYVFASYLIRLRPKQSVCKPHFLTYYLIFMRDRLKQLATKAVHQANINATNLKSLTVPLPSLPEQSKIIQVLSTVDKKLEIAIGERGKLRRIKQGLMDLLLTGRVRVKVD